MSKYTFAPATRKGNKLLCGVYGASGSGKTRWALELARRLAGEKKVALIDTEQGRAAEYVGVNGIEFDTLQLTAFFADDYVEAITAAVKAGEYGALVIDSLSPVWDGKGGALDTANSVPASQQAHGQIWNKKINPAMRRLIATLTRATSSEFDGSLNIIVTMRAKTDYETVGGSRVPIPVDPIMGKGVEYEMSLFGAIYHDHTFRVTKAPPDSGLDGWASDSLDEVFLGRIADWVSKDA